MAWEHHCETTSLDFVDRELAAFSEQGWELVSVASLPNSTYPLVMFFKRPVPVVLET